MIYWEAVIIEFIYCWHYYTCIYNACKFGNDIELEMLAFTRVEV